jgi:arylsulfatase A
MSFSTRLTKRVLIVLASVLALLDAAGAQSSPNIIFILADDLGWGELGCYGQKLIRTPHIDRLAAEGMRFTTCYAGNAVCAPSRCSLMTGKHPGHAFVRNNRELPGRTPDGETFTGQTPLPEVEITLPEQLKSAGYTTACIGKWGLGSPHNSGDPQKQGFDHFFGYYCQRHAHNHYPRFLFRDGVKVPLEGNDGGATGRQYSQDLFMREADSFIRQNAARPFFLYLPVTLTHLSIQVPEESLAEYRGKFAEDGQGQPGGYFKHPTPRAGYAAMVTHLDGGIGKLMALLRERRLDEKTVVFFSSDNGPAYERLGGVDSDFFHSAGDLRGRKGSLYEGGLRVPLIARWPGKIKAGAVSAHLCAFWDLFPTICDLAAVPVPDRLDGLSLAAELLGRGSPRTHEFFYWEFPAYGRQQAVRAGDWKAVRQKTGAPNGGAIELYNLAVDPSETRNVAAEHRDIVHQLTGIMQREHAPSIAFPLEGVDPIR